MIGTAMPTNLRTLARQRVPILLLHVIIYGSCDGTTIIGKHIICIVKYRVKTTLHRQTSSSEVI